MDPLPSLDSALQTRARELIEQALIATHGSVAQAADLIQTSRVSIYPRMRRLGIDHRAFRLAEQTQAAKL